MKQEPVAWMEDAPELYVSNKQSSTYTIPLYTTPQTTPFPKKDGQGGWIIDLAFLFKVYDLIPDDEYKPSLEGVELVLLALEKAGEK